jgi:endonuclease G, mitochondrial
MKQLILVFFLVISSLNSVLAQFNYLPSEIAGHQVVVHTQFTLSYNEQHEQADWVAYKLTKAEVEMDVPRCDCFAPDNSILFGSAKESDYSNTGFDKGHLSPSEDNQNSDAVNKESFLMSNMSPQLPGFNRGIWADLESWVRDQAVAHDTIYVVTGPVFVNDLGTIGANGVTIPGYFYKVLLLFDGTTVKTIAFLLPQIGAVGQIKDYVVTVNSIETLTGIDFFPSLDSSIENKAESQFELNKWGL